jgi:hypothetical protein
MCATQLIRKNRRYGPLWHCKPVSYALGEGGLTITVKKSYKMVGRAFNCSGFCWWTLVNMVPQNVGISGPAEWLFN